MDEKQQEQEYREEADRLLADAMEYLRRTRHYARALGQGDAAQRLDEAHSRAVDAWNLMR